MSSPLVSSEVVTIMSEFYPEKKFTTSTMLEYLNELGEKDIIKDVPTGCPNVYINNGIRYCRYWPEDEELYSVLLEILKAILKIFSF